MNNKDNINNSITCNENKFKNLNFDVKLYIVIFIFSLSLLVSSIIISNSIKSLNYNFSNQLNSISNDISDLPNLLTNNFSHLAKEPKAISQHTLSIEDAATYLGIASDELWKVVNDPDSKIPHFQVGNSRCFFTKEGLDKWLEGTYTLNFDVK